MRDIFRGILTVFIFYGLIFFMWLVYMTAHGINLYHIISKKGAGAP
jgi:hypothetical protein